MPNCWRNKKWLTPPILSALKRGTSTDKCERARGCTHTHTQIISKHIIIKLNFQCERCYFQKRRLHSALLCIAQPRQESSSLNINIIVLLLFILAFTVLVSCNHVYKTRLETGSDNLYRGLRKRLLIVTSSWFTWDVPLSKWP